MNMRRILSLVAFFATLQASAQQVNPVPDYVFRNQMSVGRGTVTDTAAYFSIGPRYGANKGFMPPIVGDTATFSSGKRNGLLIFSVQKNKFLYWDSVRVQWSDMAGSSGSYITGSGITGYLPQFSASTTLDTSALFTIGNRLGIGSSTFAYTSTNTANVELNGTAGGIVGFKRNDSARGYLWHTGDNMELANTVAGSISFNTNSATRGSISSAGVWRLHNLAGTGDRVVQASSNGTLSASTSVTGLVDTTTISTRAWRQKGDDSLGAIIATKGSGTVTSVATGYGLSGGTITTTGTLLVDTLNIATRAWRQKGLDSLAALEVSGSGTTNYIPKFTASTTIGNSIIQDNGTDVGIGSNSAGARLEILRTATGAANNNTTGSVFGSLHGSGGGPSAYGFAIRHNASAYAGISGSNFVAQLVSSSTNSNALEMYTTGSTPLVLGTSATERLRIFANGRVFVGASPTDAGYQLDVNGTLRTTSSTDLASSGGEVRIAMADAGAYTLQAGGPVYFANAANTSLTTSAGLNYMAKGDNTYFTGFNFQGVAASDMFFGRTASSDDLVISTSNTGSPAERVRFRQNGDVGIGTNSPAYKLDINGTLRSVNGANFATTSGNVGIGTASPSVKLDIGATADQTLGIKSSTSNYLFAGTYQNYAIFAVNRNPSNGVFTDITKATADIAIGGLANEGLIIFNTTATNNSTATERMRLAASGELLINTTTDAGDYKLQVAGNIYGSGLAVIGNAIINTNSPFVTGANIYTNGQSLALGTQGANLMSFFTNNTERGRINSAGEWIIDASGTDAGDYKLQVVGNARIGTGKLDIASNTTFGIGVARSGTSEVAGQIYNSNGILYLGAESSAGGQIFSGSSAYAAVIGSGANYPLQFATNNATRATINTNGELLINTTTDNGDFKLQVNGNALISGSIKTANGTSSTAVPWHLGSVVATNVQLDTANYVEVEINGTFYRLAIVTPL